MAMLAKIGAVGRKTIKSRVDFRGPLTGVQATIYYLLVRRTHAGSRLSIGELFLVRGELATRLEVQGLNYLSS